MIDLHLHPRSQSRTRHLYRIAERLVAADETVPRLGAFTAGDAAIGCPSLHHLGSQAKRGRLVWSGRAELGRGRRDLECRWGAQGYRVAVAGVGRFAVAGSGGNIPFEAVREKWEELPKDSPLLVVCSKGLRSSESVRILKEKGLGNVVYLGGGSFMRA